MALLLDGKAARQKIVEELTQKVRTFASVPTLAIIQVGAQEDSNAYIAQKKRLAQEIGVKVIHIEFPEAVEEREVISRIHDLNTNKEVHGILIQIPLPAHLDKNNLIQSIHPDKDVDGLTAANIKYLIDNDVRGYIPATSRGILTLLDYYNITIAGKHVVVVGRSSLVGKPTALAFLNRDATVTIAHKETTNLKAVTQSADILVVAIGDPEFISQQYIKKDQIVIDVGINVSLGISLEEEIPKRKIKGDVAFKDVFPLVKAISPSPGGVGPMTVASLFQNLVEAYIRQSA